MPRVLTPIWGEGPAGREWWEHLRKTLTHMGWKECHEVPCLWLFPGVEGTSQAELATIVDDMLIVEKASAKRSP